MNTLTKAELRRRYCKPKMSYKTAYYAWTDAVYQTIVHDKVMAAYKCRFCTKYHLSSKHTVGDCSHIPEEYRDFFRMYTGDN